MAGPKNPRQENTSGQGGVPFFKLAASVDDDLRLGDVREYAQATGYQVRLMLVPEEARPVDEVKYHAFRIKGLLDQLAALAQDDHKIAEGVSGFFGEAFFNLVHILQEAANKLPRRAEDSTPYFRVEIVGNLPDQPASRQSETADEEAAAGV